MKPKPLSRLFAVLLVVVSACATVAPGTSEPRRIVTFADVHGDFEATQRALRLAGAIDGADHWIGGELIIVQTGDQLDRGDGEQAILELFEALAIEAREAGGQFISLLGNHELMNVALDFRYVTPGGYTDFEDAVEFDPGDPELAELDQHQRARAAAFRPGGPFAMSLAEHPVILVLDGNVFAHGGVLPQHVEYGIERINTETRLWLRGEAGQPDALRGSDSPIWTRLYSNEPDEQSTATLNETLEALGAKRMFVGHTIQEDGIQATCGGDVWCMDVGMASHYGGPIQVLEIIGDQVTILRE